MPERTVELLSIVVPVHNDAAVIVPCWERTKATLSGVPFELLFVDDGSTDGSAQVLSKLSGTDTRVKVVLLAARYGNHTATQAGLEHAHGNVLGVLPGGPSSSPEPLADALRRWRAGTDLQHSRRLVLGSRDAVQLVPSPAQRRLVQARRLAFSSAAVALMAALVVIVAQLTEAHMRSAAVIEAIVLAVAAVQLAVIGVITENLGTSNGAPRYAVGERRNIAPPVEPLSELEELVSELDLER
jgi:hypothetical protein